MVRNQIIGSIERAETLYEYGAVMQLFPPNKSFQKHLADAKTGVLLAPTGYQTHFGSGCLESMYANNGIEKRAHSFEELY